MTAPESSPRSRTAGPNLDIQVSYRLGPPLIYVRGEVDHDSAPYLRDAIVEESSAIPPVLLLELSDVSYIDSGGLSLLFEIVRKYPEPGWVGLVGVRANVARILELTGFGDLPGVRLLPDLKAAAAALAGASP